MTAIHLDDAIVLDNSLLLQSHAGGGGGGDGGVSGGGGKGPAAPSFRNRPPERALFANSMNDPAIQWMKEAKRKKTHHSNKQN